VIIPDFTAQCRVRPAPKLVTPVSWELTIQNRYRFDLDGGRRAVAADGGAM